MRKYFKRMWWASKIYRWFPKKYCWADLVSWGLGHKPLSSIFSLFNDGGAKACMADSMDKILETGNNDSCYCCCWKHGHHFKSEQGKEITRKIKEETMSQPVEGFPF